MLFVTSRLAKEFSLETRRKEWLSVNTFGQRAMGSNLREVIGLNLTQVGGGIVSSIEAFVFPKISTVPNEHLKIVRELSPFGKHMPV